MKKLCIALVSALAFGAVNAEETDLVVVGSGGAGLSAAIMAAHKLPGSPAVRHPAFLSIRNFSDTPG